ncbi:hypothetical protein IEO21_07480 [Rhodonia placenta]|uniref:Cytochrome P450 n=1 Tax=Rhodonia placenta TaxID=104341 RepID=A0A8H7NXZ7_9APHY|nr:hypothetical protein IEO21_07480 [Postia placenta]
MIEGEGWDKLNVIELSSINEHMQKFALGVITRCGFGMPFHWVSPDDPDMSYEEALATASSGAIARLATPRIAYRLPIKRLRKVDKANKRLAVLMRQFVETRRSELAGNHEADDATGHDIFTRLVYASQLEGEKGLTDSELVRLAHLTPLTADFYMTTAHTLSATLALLALHNEEQDTTVKNILDVLRDGRDPTFDDYPKLEHVRACFLEAARMFREYTIFRTHALCETACPCSCRQPCNTRHRRGRCAEPASYERQQAACRPAWRQDSHRHDRHT